MARLLEKISKVIRTASIMTEFLIATSQWRPGDCKQVEDKMTDIVITISKNLYREIEI
jgi:hypothetical protein